MAFTAVVWSCVSRAGSPKHGRSSRRVIDLPDAVIITGFFVQLAAALSLSISIDRTEGISLIARDCVYLVFISFLTSFLSRMDTDRMFAIFARIGFAGVLVFFIASTLTLAMKGVNAISVYASGVASANPSVIQYQIFNKLLGTDDPADGTASAARHSICLYLNIVSALVLGVAAGSDRFTFSRAVAFSLPIFYSILSLSRQATVVAAAVITSFIYLMRSSVLTGLAIAGTAALVVTIPFTPVGELLAERFVSDIATNDRANMVRDVTRDVRGYELSGVGNGTQINHFHSEAYFAHNYVFHYYHQAGVAGLLLALLHVGVIGLLLLNLVFGASSTDKRVRERAVIALCLLSCPAIRYLVGVRGEMEYCSAWAAAFAFAIYRRERGRITLPRDEGTLPRPTLRPLA
ncbi:MAG: hypothetical protein AAF532_14325 [Planctomycetota bacterium]